MRVERSRENAQIRRRSRGWVLQVAGYTLWSLDRAEVVRAAERLRMTLVDRTTQERSVAVRRVCDRVMD